MPTGWKGISRHGLLEDAEFAFQFRGQFGFGGKVEFVAAGENLFRLVRAEEVFQGGARAGLPARFLAPCDFCNELSRQGAEDRGNPRP